MHPGDTAQTLTGNFTNATGQPEYVSHRDREHRERTKSGTAPPGTCDATDYTLANPVATVDAEVPVGSPETTITWTGPTIKFNDDPAVNQDGLPGSVRRSLRTPSARQQSSGGAARPLPHLVSSCRCDGEHGKRKR